jgi:hypothetical protein
VASGVKHVLKKLTLKSTKAKKFKMADYDGDPAKQPPECKSVFTPFSDDFPKSLWDIGDGKWSKCPNIYEDTSYIDMDGEQYYCDVCGKHYYLDYEDMK